LFEIRYGTGTKEAVKRCRLHLHDGVKFVIKALKGGLNKFMAEYPPDISEEGRQEAYDTTIEKLRRAIEIMTEAGNVWGRFSYGDF
jgi:hypothetical protein